MRSRLVCLADQWAVILCVASLEPATAQVVPIGAIDEAKRVVELWLRRAESDPEWFRRKWELPTTEDFSTVRLEEPYVFYVMQIWDIVDYHEAEDSDIISSTRLMYYGFPLTNKGRHIGSLTIIHNRTSTGDKIIEGVGEFTVGRGELPDSNSGSRKTVMPQGLERRVLLPSRGRPLRRPEETRGPQMTPTTRA